MFLIILLISTHYPFAYFYVIGSVCWLDELGCYGILGNARMDIIKPWKVYSGYGIGRGGLHFDLKIGGSLLILDIHRYLWAGEGLLYRLLYFLTWNISPTSSYGSYFSFVISIYFVLGTAVGAIL